MVVERRYRYTTDTMETIRAAVKTTVFGWVFFGLGTHGYILKLAFATGNLGSRSGDFLMWYPSSSSS